MTPKLDRLFALVAESRASDLHLIVGVAPSLRVNGEILFADTAPLTEQDTTAFLEAMLNPLQRSAFERDWELCVSLHHATVGRMRVTLYKRNGTPEFRVAGAKNLSHSAGADRRHDLVRPEPCTGLHCHA